MPELPEVETIRIGLNKLVLNKKIASIKSNWQKSYPNSVSDTDNFVIGSGIKKISRRAKILIIELTSGYSLLIHLKMTGQLVYRGKDHKFAAGHPSPSMVNRLPDRSTRVIMTFSDDSKLYFNDQRKFGWIKLLPTSEVRNILLIKSLGPEPLRPDFSWQILKERLSRRNNTNIKAALLDQTVIAGIGNIYADESLWYSKINPQTLVKNLSNLKIKSLRDGIVLVLNTSITRGGTSNQNYVNAKGEKGSYLLIAKVFKRQGLPCYRCGHIIKKIRVAGRGTHYCPHCQRRVVRR